MNFCKTETKDFSRVNKLNHLTEQNNILCLTLLSTIDIVMDNVGLELISDLALSDLLVTSGMASEVRFRVKAISWFVSDTMEKDIHWTLDQLEKVEELKVRKLYFFVIRF